MYTHMHSTVREQAPTRRLPVTPSLFTQDVESLVEAEGAEKKARVKKGAKKNKSKPVTLTWEQKLEIAKSELEAVKKDATETEKNSVRMIDTLKVSSACVCVFLFICVRACMCAHVCIRAHICVFVCVPPYPSPCAVAL